LPVPLYPINPIRSLGWICQVASSINTREPNSKVTLVNPASIMVSSGWPVVSGVRLIGLYSPVTTYHVHFFEPQK
jgi:hypothetical protein